MNSGDLPGGETTGGEVTGNRGAPGGLRLGSVVLNVPDMARAIGFWTAALSYRARDAELRHDFVVLVPARGDGPALSLQLTDRPKSGVNRVHLDLYSEQQQADVQRLVALGAGRPAWDYPPDADFVVLTDPADNEFCVIDC